MANKVTRYLKDFGKGLLKGALNPRGGIGNYQHATRVFVDNQYQFSPRVKFLFYVEFVINDEAMSPQFREFAKGDTLGVLVKSADLPKYSFDSQVNNQYNRKKITYTQINYQPVTISMHDDTAGITNALIASYYGHYVNDRFADERLYYDDGIDPGSLFTRHGLDVNRNLPFFKAIKIYTMSRRRFHEYHLVNPRIQTVNHGDVAYADGSAIIENSMTIEYEAVIYNTGSVEFGTPGGFGDLYYDRLPSPLTFAGGGTGALFGEGGILDGVSGALDPNRSLFERIAGIASAVRGVDNLSSSSVAGEIVGNVFSTFSGQSNENLQFPKTPTNDDTVAILKPRGNVSGGP